MKLIKRNTRLKNFQCYKQKMEDIASELGLEIKVMMTNSTNLIFHVDIEIEAIVRGTDEQIDIFEKLIES